MVNTDIINAYLGSSQVDKIMLGSEQVYPTAEPVYSEMYLTVEALESGTFYVRKPNIDYSVNGGEWETTTGETALALNQGDEVRFKGSITSGSQIRGLFSGNTLATVVYGNPLSLQYLLFPTEKNRAFQMVEMFLNNTGVVDASHLDFSGIMLVDYSLQNTFYGCTSLTKAPTLPFSHIPGNDSCDGMFYGCSSLKYIRCLATNITYSGTDNWVKNVSPTGTFVKTAGVSWATGNNGIPSGWTVIEEGDKLTFEDSDGVTGDGQQYSPGEWQIQQTISNIASYTLYYGGEVVTANTHVTITNDWGGTTDYDADETGMVWSGVTYGYGYGDSGTIDVNINYSVQNGTAELFVHYYTDLTPPDTCEDWESGGYSSYEECRCVNYGEGCEDSCNGDPECECVNQGGTWNGTDCEFPDPCAGDPECECLNQGGTWNGTDCEFPQPDEPQPEPDE